MVSTEIKLITFFVVEDGEAVYSQQKKKKKRPGADCGSDNELSIAEERKGKSLSHVQLFVTPTDPSLPGSSVHGTSHSRILELVAISSSIVSSQPRNRTVVSFPASAGRFFTTEPPGKTRDGTI